MKFNPLQFQIHHPYNINKTAHPQNNIQKKTNKINHPLIKITLQKIINHHRKFFKITNKITQTVTHRLQNIITPNDNDQSNNIQI